MLVRLKWEQTGLALLSLKKERGEYIHSCICAIIYINVGFCVYILVFECICPREMGWIIYSLRGHLLTESNPLTGPRPNGGLTRLLLYIAAVMGTSLEIVVLLICAWLSRFEHFAHRPSPLGNSWCITAAMDQSICLLPALPSLCSLPARTAILQAALCNSVMPRHACPPLPSLRGITNRTGTLLVSAQLVVKSG